MYKIISFGLFLTALLFSPTCSSAQNPFILESQQQSKTDVSQSSQTQKTSHQSPLPPPLPTKEIEQYKQEILTIIDNKIKQSQQQSKTETLGEWEIVGMVNNLVILKNKKGDMETADDKSVFNECYIEYPSIMCGEGVKKKLDAFEKKINDLTAESAQYKDKSSSLQSDIEAKQNELSDIKKEIKVLQEKLTESNSEKEKSSVKMNELESQIASLNSLLNGKELSDIKKPSPFKTQEGVIDGIGNIKYTAVKEGVVVQVPNEKKSDAAKLFRGVSIKEVSDKSDTYFLLKAGYFQMVNKGEK